MSFWIVPFSLSANTPRLGKSERQCEKDREGGVDIDRSRDTFQRQFRQQRFHIFERGDRNSNASDLPPRQSMVGIAAHLGGQVERHGKPGLAVGKQITITAV